MDWRTDGRTDGLARKQVESAMPKRLGYDNEVPAVVRPRPPTSPATVAVAISGHCINHVTVTRFSRFLADFRATINALLTGRVTSYLVGARVIGGVRLPVALFRCLCLWPTNEPDGSFCRHPSAEVTGLAISWKRLAHIDITITLA